MRIDTGHNILSLVERVSTRHYTAKKPLHSACESSTPTSSWAAFMAASVFLVAGQDYQNHWSNLTPWEQAEELAQLNLIDSSPESIRWAGRKLELHAV